MASDSISPFADTQFGRCCCCATYNWLIPKSSLYNTSITLFNIVEISCVYTRILLHYCVYIILCLSVCLNTCAYVHIYLYISVFMCVYVMFSFLLPSKGRSLVVSIDLSKADPLWTCMRFQLEELDWDIQFNLSSLPRDRTVMSHHRWGAWMLFTVVYSVQTHGSNRWQHCSFDTRTGYLVLRQRGTGNIHQPSKIKTAIKRECGRWRCD